MPMASPSTRRAPIRAPGDHAAALISEPITNRPALKISERLRPKCTDSHAASAAPIAAPTIMLLTMRSSTASLTPNSCWMNCCAPEITPTSRPNIRPASAASVATKAAWRRAWPVLDIAVAFISVPLDVRKKSVCPDGGMKVPLVRHGDLSGRFATARGINQVAHLQVHAVGPAEADHVGLVA